VQPRTFLRYTTLFLLAIAQQSFASDFLPSFPGAEGFGAVASGGRGGRVIKVTNLNASGPGSLQAACAEEGPRIVVFEVGGVIRGDVRIMHSNITIAGQTAPAPGITLAGRILSRYADDIRLHDIVIRHMRIRPRPERGVHGDAIQLSKTERVMLDHLSLSWANDEMIDLIHSSEVSIQWCTVEESDPLWHDKGTPHNFALLSAYPGSGNISIHHNLFAHHSRRLPSISPQVNNKPADFRNNVVYNFRDGLSHEGHTPKAPINLVANYYKRGPNAEIIFPFNFDPEGFYFVSGNYIDGIGQVDDPHVDTRNHPSWYQPRKAGNSLKEPADVARVSTDTALKAYERVIAQAGAWPRDRITLRTLEEVKTGTGRWGRGAPPSPSDAWFLDGMSRGTPPLDTDGDGLPDDWEKKHKLNPKVPGDQNTRIDGRYTAIELYINEIASANVRARK